MSCAFMNNVAVSVQHYVPDTMDSAQCIYTRCCTRPVVWRARAHRLLSALSLWWSRNTQLHYNIDNDVSLLQCNYQSCLLLLLPINTAKRSTPPTPTWTRLRAECARAALFVCVERLEMAESRDQSDNLGLHLRVRRHWNTETTHKWLPELLACCSSRWDTSQTQWRRIFWTRFGSSRAG